MYDKDDLKRFISDILDSAYEMPDLYLKNTVKELIFYRVDLVETWKQ